MKEAYTVREAKLKDELVSMIADVAVQATEQHLEVLTLFKNQNVEIATLRSDVDQVKADVAQVKADVAQVKADVSSLKAKMIATEVSAERRHDELLNTIRALRGVPGASYAV